MNWTVFSGYALVSTLLLFLCRSLASADEKPKCTFPNHTQDPKTLKRLDALVGYSFDTQDDNDEYQYALGICTKATKEETGKGFDDAGVIQVKMADKKKHIIGKFSDADIRGGTDWVMLEYHGGEKYNTHCGKENKSSILMISCDPDIVSIDDVKLKLLEEESKKNSGCYYLFEINHYSVCNDSPLVTFSLSIGSIVVIVFISVCALYLLLGFLYNRFLLGAKGMEQIPNYSFWKDFGNLQADGCNFICRTGRGQEPRSYKGIGDDQLQEEDERDDHLLPM